MKPRVGVYLSEQTAGLLEAAAERPGATKSALVEAALDRFLGSDAESDEAATIARGLAGLSRQIEQLDRDLRTVAETVSLHARFHLASTPAMPERDLRGACRLGSERFEEFATQVERRVELGTSLMRETIERLRAPEPGRSAGHQPSGEPDEETMSAGGEPCLPVSTAMEVGAGDPAAAAENGGHSGLRGGSAAHAATIADRLRREAAARPRPAFLTARATPRAHNRVGPNNVALTLRVFLPFAAGCYLAFLFRTINALVAAPLAQEFGLGAGDLGLLTSIYFLTFAAAQIPVGIILDRDGPRRVQSALLLAMAAGSALFASSESFWGLLGARALIGLGVAAALTAGLQSLILWFPRERVPLLNGLMITFGALGAVTATLPAELLLTAMGWRGLFDLLAASAAAVALVIYVVVPAQAPARPLKREPTLVSLRRICADPGFRRLAPLSATSVGTAWALHGLWAAQWFDDVGQLDRTALVQHLFAMAVALCAAALALGVLINRLRRRGIGPETLLSMVTVIFIAAQLSLILRWPLPSLIPWAIIAAVGAATVLSFAVLAETIPSELAGRANGALNVFHIGGAFVLQYATGYVLQHWTPQAGHYPEIAYQAAFAFNVVLQVAALIWFVIPRGATRPHPGFQQSASKS